MTSAEILSVCSLTVFTLSLLLSIWNFAYTLRSSRVTQTERLHEVWWTREMIETRDEVYAMCRAFALDPTSADPLIEYYQHPLSTPEPPGRAAFSKLVGFFCNLEICLASGVLDNRLATRLFAEAHYADYQPLIHRLREAIAHNSTPERPLPQWLDMTLDLERRFFRHRPRARRVRKTARTGGSTIR